MVYFLVNLVSQSSSRCFNKILPCIFNLFSAEYEWQPYKGKVYSLSWLIKNEDGCCLSEQPNTDLLLSCGPKGEMVCSLTLSFLLCMNFTGFFPLHFLR